MRSIVTCGADEDLVPYLFGLKQQFTQYQLLDILAMKSVYSIRIYELLKSYAGLKKKVFELDDLKKKLMVEDISSYNRFPDFRRSEYTIAMATAENMLETKI